MATHTARNLHRGICPLFPAPRPRAISHQKFVRECAKMVNGAAALAARQHDDQESRSFPPSPCQAATARHDRFKPCEPFQWPTPSALELVLRIPAPVANLSRMRLDNCLVHLDGGPRSRFPVCSGAPASPALTRLRIIERSKIGRMRPLF